ncbi:hypothetical protein TRVL_06700 [Trypanosoma vivax]|nr:hypothetical protein TRVL_06700 [Trypanosoma vivax]
MRQRAEQGVGQGFKVSKLLRSRVSHTLLLLSIVPCVETCFSGNGSSSTNFSLSYLLSQRYVRTGLIRVPPFKRAAVPAANRNISSASALHQYPSVVKENAIQQRCLLSLSTQISDIRPCSLGPADAFYLTWKLRLCTS